MRKAVIIEAGNMSDETYEYICQGIRNKFKEEFAFRRAVDPKVVGGFVINIEGKVFDLSICSQLDLMNKHIID